MKFNSANLSSFSKPWITEDFGLAALQIFFTFAVIAVSLYATLWLQFIFSFVLVVILSLHFFVFKCSFE